MLIKLEPILHDSQQSEVLMHGLATIADIVARYAFHLDVWQSNIVSCQSNSKNVVGKSVAISHPAGTGSEDPVHLIEKQSALEQKFCELVIKLYRSILDYQIKAALYLNKGTLLRIARNVPKVDDWSSMLATVARFDAECGRYQSIAHSMEFSVGFNLVLQRLRDQEKMLEKLIRSQDRMEQEALRFARLLSAVNVWQDHGDVRSRLGSQYWDSGQWLLHHCEYIEWCKSSTDVLWLRGLVGSGKTCLASIVIQEALSNSVDEKVAFFYCSQQQRGTAADGIGHGSCEPVDVLRSLLAQMSLDIDGQLSPPLRT